MRVKQFNEEVLFAVDPIVKIGFEDIQWLKEQARVNARHRIRVCVHRDTEDTLHEMFIVHARGAYVRPHKHLGKSESFHVIEGEVDVVFFDENGGITEVVPMGNYSSQKRFFYRVGTPSFHTLLITSEVLVFHETTEGPFRREDTVFAPFAPDETEPTVTREFQERLAESVERLKFARETGSMPG